MHAVQLRPCRGRLGAAKALAGCAAELGRPGMEAVAGEVALEALRAAVTGLRLADRDAPGTGTQEALADALKARAAGRPALTRAVSARLTLLCTDTAGRLPGHTEVVTAQPERAASPSRERRPSSAGRMQQPGGRVRAPRRAWCAR
jgi:hypothetical protein